MSIYSSGEAEPRQPKMRGVEKVHMHVALHYSIILAAAITIQKTGIPEQAHSIKAFQ